MRGASLTALIVSAARGVEHDANGEQLDPFAADLLPPIAGRAVRVLSSLTARAPVAIAVDLASLGLVAHVALRTLAIDAEVRRFMHRFADRSVSAQLLILGAGADSRAHRLEALRGAPVFEVDHPDTQSEKRDRAADLPRFGALTYVPVDFERDSLDGALASAHFDRSQPTFVIWEGVTMYLTPEVFVGTLRVLRALLAPGSVLAATYGLPRMTRLMPQAVTRVAAVGFDLLGESLRGLMTSDTVAARLRDEGYQLVSDTGPIDWAHEAGRRRWRSAVLERLVVAEVVEAVAAKRAV
jgi:methyltransferase (TIGR00027 family)